MILRNLLVILNEFSDNQLVDSLVWGITLFLRNFRDSLIDHQFMNRYNSMGTFIRFSALFRIVSILHSSPAKFGTFHCDFDGMIVQSLVRKM